MGVYRTTVPARWIGVAAIVVLTLFSPFPVQAQESVPSQCSGHVVITFDDGPNALYTPIVLDILKKHGVMAVFFPNGSRVARHDELIKRITAEGHQIANHGWEHDRMTTQSIPEVLTSLENTYTAIEEAGGKPIRVFRPPYGASSPEIREATSAAGWAQVTWDVDPQDYMGRSAEYIRDHVIEVARPGSNILAHDRLETTATALEEIIIGVHAKGLCFGGFTESGQVAAPSEVARYVPIWDLYPSVSIDAGDPVDTTPIAGSVPSTTTTTTVAEAPTTTGSPSVAVEPPSDQNAGGGMPRWAIPLLAAGLIFAACAGLVVRRNR